MRADQTRVHLVGVIALKKRTKLRSSILRQDRTKGPHSPLTARDNEMLTRFLSSQRERSTSEVHYGLVEVFV